MIKCEIMSRITVPLRLKFLESLLSSNLYLRLQLSQHFLNKKERKKETKQATGLKTLWSLLIRREHWYYRMCVVWRREALLAGDQPHLVAMMDEVLARNYYWWVKKIFATDLCKFQVNIFKKIRERLEIVAFFRMWLFQIWNPGLSVFGYTVVAWMCQTGVHGRACALLNWRECTFPCFLLDLTSNLYLSIIQLKITIYSPIFPHLPFITRTNRLKILRFYFVN